MSDKPTSVFTPKQEQAIRRLVQQGIEEFRSGIVANAQAHIAKNAQKRARWEQQERQRKARQERRERVFRVRRKQ